jgi:hypothetical protein
VKAIALAAALLITGCRGTARVGVGERMDIPRDSAGQCTRLCDSIGLGLDSVVVMASNVGCVCRAAPAPGAAPAASASAGGMAAILIQEAAAAESARQAQQRRSSPPPSTAPR